MENEGPTVEEGAQAEWPKYRSHKEVHALKLREVRDDAAVGHTMFVPHDSRYAPVVYPNGSDPVRRCKARETGDPGYLVTYRDGFTSWSPTRAFEDGYTQL